MTDQTPSAESAGRSDDRIRPVSIKALAWDIEADLRFPPDFDESSAYPTIICAHPIGSTKDQTAGRIYGQALADAGFVTIAFDASFQGASGGEPRHLEDPTFRVQDFSYVVDFLVTQPFVDPDRIGVLGMCGGGGYTINAATTERRLKAVGTVTGANYGRLFHESFGQYDPIGTLEAIAEQRTAEARGEEIRVDGRAFGSVQEAEAAGLTDVDALGAIDYYTRRDPHPSGSNESVFSRLGTAVGWDAFVRINSLLTQPLCVVVGDKPGSFGAYRDGFEVIRRAPSEHKELVVVEGWTHYDLYDQPEPVQEALDHLIPFYRAYL